MVYQSKVVRYFGMTTIMNGSPSGISSMNDSKTEFIQFGSRQQLEKCVTDHLSVNECAIPKVTVIKYLGTYLDQNLSIKLHIRNKCRNAMANYHCISIIRKYLTGEECKQIVHGLIISHIDYSNSLYYGLPNVTSKSNNVFRALPLN